MPAEVGGERSGAQPRHQPDGGAQAAGGDGDVQRVAAGAGHVAAGRPFRPGVGPRNRQQVDDQFPETLSIGPSLRTAGP